MSLLLLDSSLACVTRQSRELHPVTDAARPNAGEEPPDRAPTSPSTRPTLGFESTDFDWDEYETRVYRVVWPSWYQSLWQEAKHGAFSTEQKQKELKKLRGSCVVRISIQRDGTIIDSEMVGPSSLTSLNAAVLKMLKDLKLPPLPRTFPRDRERLKMGFILEADDENQILINIRTLRLRGEIR